MQRTTQSYKGYVYIKNKLVSYKNTYFRWLALFLGCVCLFGHDYVFDNPQALEVQIEKELDIDTVQFNLLYIVYSIPNIIMPLFGGFLIDWLGVRVGLIIFTTIMTAGQCIVTTGAYYKSFWIIIVGRSLFGIGSECLIVSQSAIISYWFQNKELSFAIGLNFSLPTIGSALNSLITPKVYEYTGSLTGPFMVGTVICFVSLLACILLVIIDKKSEQVDNQIKTIMKKKSKRNRANNEESSSESYFMYMQARQASKGHISDELEADKLEKSSLREGISSLNEERKEPAESVQEKPKLPAFGEKNSKKSKGQKENQNFLSVPPASSKARKNSASGAEQQAAQGAGEQRRVERNNETSDADEEDFSLGESLPANQEEKISFKDIKHFKIRFWLLLLVCSLLEGSFYSFFDNANKFLQVRFGYDSNGSGNALFLPYFIAAFCSPIFGTLADRTGRKGILIIITVAVLNIAVFFLTILPHCVELCYISLMPLILCGIFYSLYTCTCIPAVPLLVKSNMIGTAFGLVGVSQNIAMSVFPLITATIVESSFESGSSLNGAFVLACCFLLVLNGITFMTAVFLNIIDCRGRKLLDRIPLKKEDLGKKFSWQLNQKTNLLSVKLKESEVKGLIDVDPLNVSEFLEENLLNSKEYENSNNLMLLQIKRKISKDLRASNRRESPSGNMIFFEQQKEGHK